MSNYLFSSYEILSKIYRDKTYSTEALYSALENKENPELIHRIVLGTLEKDVELSYVLFQLTKKPPKPSVAIVIKQGLYCLKYMDSLPDYAVINNSVELIKLLGKIPLAGFVNAVLNSAARGEYKMPEKDGSFGYYAVELSKPEWLIKLLSDEYGKEVALEILSTPNCTLSHIRANRRMMSDGELENLLKKEKIPFEKTEAGGFGVKVTPMIKGLFAEGKITYQSATSMLAAAALDVVDGMKVLDICASPGGKSVLIAERNPKAEVVACDLYPHRVTLIEKYASRMKIKNVFAAQNDATIFNPEYEGRFDRVLVDVPCSALGIIRKQPDILLNRKPDDINELASLQLKIAQNAVKYLKPNGKMVYSTCTVTKEENGDNVQKILKSNPELTLISEKQYLPDRLTDGFFVAVFNRNETSIIKL